MKKIEEYVRSIPDFPEPGIIFRDITSVLQDADGLQLANRLHAGMSERCGRRCSGRYRVQRIYLRSADRLQSS